MSVTPKTINTNRLPIQRWANITIWAEFRMLNLHLLGRNSWWNRQFIQSFRMYSQLLFTVFGKSDWLAVWIIIDLTKIINLIFVDQLVYE